MRTRKNPPEKQTKKLSKIGYALAIVYALYITFILLSRIPLLAEEWVESEMEDTYEYHITFPTDGNQSHYDVERYNQSSPGYIHVKYITANNTLIVDAKNIKVLGIDCRSMYEDEYLEVFGMDAYDNSNYYKWYFIEKDHLKVQLNSDNNISRLEFKDTPMPYEVRVNSEIWIPDFDYSYTNNYGTIISEIPKGHNWVDIFFKSPGTTCPTAKFTVNGTEVEIYELLAFNATESSDPDGQINNYFWDFGDGTFLSGSAIVSHHYTKIGTYSVILTVRDDDHLLDRAYKSIIVVPEKSEDGNPSILGTIPNQELAEDFEPWSLNLNQYESITEVPNNPLNWWVTGVDTSLYTVVGENSSADTLTFSPVENAFGNDRVTIWLGDNRGIVDSQTIWINISSVNDAPTIFGAPNLVIRYDQLYPFNFLPYVNDIETNKEELIISTSDSEHTEVSDGLTVNFKYPKSMLGETTFVILTVSDGEDIGEDVIIVSVSDDWVPILKKPLPDVYLYEGETKLNYFDLDDYYSDPDGDALYYSYGYTHIEITIQKNHSVDFKAPDDWWGHEIVTFRATDPAGAKMEDIIEVNIEAINDAPVIIGVPDLSVHYEELYQFDLFPYVRDEDNTLEELTISTTESIKGKWKDSAENGYIQVKSTDNLVLLFNYPKSYLGNAVLVNITVSDGEHSGSQLIKVWIWSNYPPELVQPLPDIIMVEDIFYPNALDLSVYFIDKDFDNLYYSKGEVKINVTIDNINGTVDLSAEENWHGSEFVTFRATDPVPYLALAEDTILITVIPVNDAPVIDIIPTQNKKVGDTWVLDLLEYIHDVDNNLTELNITVDANDVDCDVRGTEIVFYGTSAAKKTITLMVNDGSNSVKQTVLVVISQPQEEKGNLLVLNLIGALIVIIIAIISLVSYRKYKSKYTVEEVFLILKSGDLICHKTREHELQIDEDILSGMFTAVQAFIKESFATRADTGEDWALDELKVGKDKILIVRGRYVYLTVIFSGSSLAGKKLRKRIKTTLTTVEDIYKIAFEKWTGEMSKVDGVDEILIKLVPTNAKPEKH